MCVALSQFVATTIQRDRETGRRRVRDEHKSYHAVGLDRSALLSQHIRCALNIIISSSSMNFFSATDREKISYPHHFVFSSKIICIAPRLRRIFSPQCTRMIYFSLIRIHAFLRYTTTNSNRKISDLNWKHCGAHHTFAAAPHPLVSKYEIAFQYSHTKTRAALWSQASRTFQIWEKEREREREIYSSPILLYLIDSQSSHRSSNRSAFELFLEQISFIISLTLTGRSLEFISISS